MTHVIFYDAIQLLHFPLADQSQTCDRSVYTMRISNVPKAYLQVFMPIACQRLVRCVSHRYLQEEGVRAACEHHTLPLMIVSIPGGASVSRGEARPALFLPRLCLSTVRER
jgi:hypothetical protein